MRMGEGVKKSEHFAVIISGSSLMMNFGYINTLFLTEELSYKMCGQLKWGIRRICTLQPILKLRTNVEWAQTLLAFSCVDRLSKQSLARAWAAAEFRREDGGKSCFVQKPQKREHFLPLMIMARGKRGDYMPPLFQFFINPTLNTANQQLLACYTNTKLQTKL